MGKIEEMDFKRIVPTQSWLYSDYAKNFIESYKKNPKDIIVPVVRLDNRDLLLDGHHSIFSIELKKNFFKNKAYIWLVNNEEDYIKNLEDNFHNDLNVLENKNHWINERYHIALEGNFRKTLKELKYQNNFNNLFEDFLSKSIKFSFNLN